jgi:outer membrane protein assembly complex protein YaeT
MRTGVFLFLVTALLVPIGSSARTGDVLEGAAYKGWNVSSLETSGIPVHLANPLRKGLAYSGQREILWTQRPRFFPETLDEDIRRTRLFLAQRGYPSASAIPRFFPDAKRNNLRILLEIELGNPVLIEEVSAEGLPASLESQLLSAVTLKPGTVFAEEELDQSRRNLLRLLNEASYVQAHLTHYLTFIDSTHVSVRFEVDPGEVSVFSRVRVRGVSPDLVSLAVRTADIPLGTFYTPEVLRRSQSSLRLLNLFRQIRVSTTQSAPGSLDVELDLTERKHRTTQIGVGYWTDDQLRFRILWRHRNMFKQGKGFSAEARYSRFQQDLMTSLWRPGLFRSRILGISELGITQSTEENYTSRRLFLKLAATYSHSYQSRLTVSVTASSVDLEVDPDVEEDFAEEGGRFSSVAASWNRDTTSDRLSPGSGLITMLRGEVTLPGFLSEKQFILGELTTTAYHSVMEGVVIASRVRTGVAAPLSPSTDLLPGKRFFAGGASSMRGFSRRALGPVDSEGEPVGGEVRAECSIELRFPIIGRFSGAVFTDAGQVWRRRDVVALNDVEVAVGGGIMADTPVGPGRVDYGYRLTQVVKARPRRVIHFSVGHPF